MRGYRRGVRGRSPPARRGDRAYGGMSRRDEKDGGPDAAPCGRSRGRAGPSCWRRDSGTTQSSGSIREGRSPAGAGGPERVFGYSDAEIVGRPYARLFPARWDRECRRRSRVGAGEGGGACRVGAVERPQGWLVVLGPAGSWWRGATPRGGCGAYSVLIRDLTERRQIEEGLARPAFDGRTGSPTSANALGRGTSLRGRPARLCRADGPAPGCGPGPGLDVQ